MYVYNHIRDHVPELFLQFADYISDKLYICFAKIVHMIVGEYEQTAVHKRRDVVGNDLDSVL